MFWSYLSFSGSSRFAVLFSLEQMPEEVSNNCTLKVPIVFNRQSDPQGNFHSPIVYVRVFKALPPHSHIRGVPRERKLADEFQVDLRHCVVLSRFSALEAMARAIWWVMRARATSRLPQLALLSVRSEWVLRLLVSVCGLYLCFDDSDPARSGAQRCTVSAREHVRVS